MNTGIEIDPQRLLLEGMESGEFPDLEPFALAREYALESAQGSPGENEIVRWWHSPGGFFYEFKRFPAAFYGRLGLVQGEYLTPSQAQELVWEALARADKDHAEVMLFYTANLMQSDQDFFMAYTLGNIRIERGEARYALPLFMRLKASEYLLVLLRVQGEYLAFKLPKGQPILKGLLA
ncbi:hypothetical protein [uncultured Meiothermus sp.]|jgi:hypothetical protein|uniref:hypothetical protein n=1 Tax=uncultured Meiothermus sp. TaxID=157471 RepID=UPI00260B0542|nr:hypothetical protein [uncultured Meiothermus sp.]